MKSSPTLIPELKVKDFKKSLNFYTHLAGFKVLYDRLEQKFAMLDREGAQIMIEELTDMSRAMKIGKLEHPFGRGMHFQIQVSKVDNLYKTFQDNQYPIFNDMEEKWYRVDDYEVGNKQFWAQDPDGYLLRFFQDLGKRNHE